MRNYTDFELEKIAIDFILTGKEPDLADFSKEDELFLDEIWLRCIEAFKKIIANRNLN